MQFWWYRVTIIDLVSLIQVASENCCRYDIKGFNIQYQIHDF